MIRIVSDTSTLYSTAQAANAGFEVSPLSVTIAGESYREFDEISSDRFVELIKEGNMPISSQPPVGFVTELYERFADDDIINIAMADGLSGTYSSAVAAAELCRGNRQIVCINSRTLCGPHRYLVEKAVEMVSQNKSIDEIVKHTNLLMDSAKSYLIPADFGYLRRGGRLSPLVSYVGQAAKLAPVLTQTDDGKQLTIASVKRGFAHAIQYVGKALADIGVGSGWRVYISHAAAPQLAEQALELLKKAVPEAAFEVYPLSPAFITQGGPSCVAVQIIKSEP